MIINTQWLLEYLEPGLSDPEALALLPRLGFEIESETGEDVQTAHPCFRGLQFGQPQHRLGDDPRRGRGVEGRRRAADRLERDQLPHAGVSAHEEHARRQSHERDEVLGEESHGALADRAVG